MKKQKTSHLLTKKKMKLQHSIKIDSHKIKFSLQVSKMNNMPAIRLKIITYLKTEMLTNVIKKISRYFQSFVMPVWNAASQHQRSNRIMSFSIYIATS